MLEKNAGDESQNLLTWFLSPIYLQAALGRKRVLLLLFLHHCSLLKNSN